MLTNLKWTPTCCGWHGDYAEHPTKDGGMARIKRAPDVDGVLVCRFDANNRGIDVDGDGIPDYVQMTEAEALAILA